MCEQITFLTGRRLPLFAEGLLWKLPTFCPALLCLSLHLIYGVTRKSCQILDLKRPGTIYAQHWCQNYGIVTPKLWSYIAVYITWNGVSSQYAPVFNSQKRKIVLGFKIFGSTFSSREALSELWQCFELLEHKCLLVFPSFEIIFLVLLLKSGDIPAW